MDDHSESWRAHPVTARGAITVARDGPLSCLPGPPRRGVQGGQPRRRKECRTRRPEARPPATTRAGSSCLHRPPRMVDFSSDQRQHPALSQVRDHLLRAHHPIIAEGNSLFHHMSWYLSKQYLAGEPKWPRHEQRRDFPRQSAEADPWGSDRANAEMVCSKLRVLSPVSGVSWANGISLTTL